MKTNFDLLGKLFPNFFNVVSSVAVLLNVMSCGPQETIQQQRQAVETNGVFCSPWGCGEILTVAIAQDADRSALCFYEVKHNWTPDSARPPVAVSPSISSNPWGHGDGSSSWIQVAKVQEIAQLRVNLNKSPHFWDRYAKRLAEEARQAGVLTGEVSAKGKRVVEFDATITQAKPSNKQFFLQRLDDDQVANLNDIARISWRRELRPALLQDPCPRTNELEFHFKVASPPSSEEKP